MRVTQLTRSPRSPEKWTLTLESGETLSVSLDRIAEFDLFTGRDLSDGELAELRQRCQRSRVRERALRILVARMLSRKELCDRLCGKGETPEAAEEAADWLESIGALNDETYAAAVVRHYTARGYGPARIKEELYRRGIPPALRQAALDAAPEPEDRLRQAAERELSRLPDEPAARAAALRRLRDKLVRRGYDPAAVGAMLRRAAEDGDDASD